MTPAAVRAITTRWPHPLPRGWEQAADHHAEMGATADDAEYIAYVEMCHANNRDPIDGDPIVAYDAAFFDVYAWCGDPVEPHGGREPVKAVKGKRAGKDLF